MVRPTNLTGKQTELTRYREGYIQNGSREVEIQRSRPRSRKNRFDRRSRVREEAYRDTAGKRHSLACVTLRCVQAFHGGRAVRGGYSGTAVAKEESGVAETGRVWRERSNRPGARVGQGQEPGCQNRNGRVA